MTRGTLLIVVATDAERPSVTGGEVLVCGVGKTAAATATALRLANGGIGAVVSFGVAGAYPRSGLDLGDVVVATKVAILDEGLDDGVRFQPFSRPGMTVPGAQWVAADPELRTALVDGPDPGFRLVQGGIATVSVCAGTTRLAREREATGCLAEAMEGAAVAHAAAHHGVRFVEVRGISNPCGPREGAPFDLSVAVAHARRVLARLVARWPLPCQGSLS